MGKRRGSDAAVSQLELQMNQEKALKDIEKYTQLLHLKDGYEGHVGLYHRTIYMGALAECYKVLGKIENMKRTCRELIRYVNEHLSEIPAQNEQRTKGIYNYLRKAHILMAPYSFHHYLVAMEWNYPIEGKFYSNRICVMRDWVERLQRLEDGELEGLGISAPPRSGKTGIGTLFLTWVMGRNAGKSSFFATHTNAMAQKVFMDVLSLITDPMRCWDEVFPGFQIDKSAEYLWIDLSPKKLPNNYKTIYFRGIDGNMAGILEASHLLYCDDLIRGIEEARNPDRIENSVAKYGIDISQRKTNSKVRELQIATRWSTKDVLNLLEQQHEWDPKWEFVKVPALDEKGQSNFKFKYNAMDEEHFRRIREGPGMDSITWECVYQQNPIDREGLLFEESTLVHRFKTLPQQEPDEIFGACDVAFSGTDSVAFPMIYRYGDSFYMPDVVFDSRDYMQTEPLVAAHILKHQPNRARFEANNGGEFYANDVKSRVRGKTRCRIDSKRSATNVGKVARIEQFEPDIKAIYFLDKSCYTPDSPYGRFMKELCNFNVNGKNKHDDAPDSLAMTMAMVRIRGGPLLRTFSSDLLF